MTHDKLDDDTARFVRRMERWFDMDALLADRGLNTAEFARKWGVDETTVRHDREGLCEVLGWPRGWPLDALGSPIRVEPDFEDGRRKRYVYMTGQTMLAEAIRKRIRAQHPPAAKPTPQRDAPPPPPSGEGGSDGAARPDGQ